MGTKMPLVVFKKRLVAATVSASVALGGTYGVIQFVKWVQLTPTESAIRALRSGESNQQVIDRLNRALVHEATNANIRGAEEVLEVIRQVKAGKPRDELRERLQDVTWLPTETQRRIDEVATAAATRQQMPDFCQAVALCEGHSLWEEGLHLLDAVRPCDSDCSQAKRDLEARQVYARARLEQWGEQSGMAGRIVDGVSIAECAKTRELCDCIDAMEKAFCREYR